MRTLLVALFLLPVTSLAEVDFTGSFWSRAVVLPELKKLSNTEALFSHSLQLKGSIHPAQNLQTHFWLFSSPQWGEDSSIQKSFRLHAYGNWNITEELKLRLGHIPYEIDSSFIAQNHYEPFPYMFEGIFLSYSAHFVSLDFWGAHPPKRRVGAEEKSGSRYALGAAMDVKATMEFLKRIHLHLIYLTDSFREEDSSKRTSRYGLNIKGEIGNQRIDYNFSFAGLNFKAEETMFNIETGYSHPKWYDSRAFISYHRDTENYNPWLYDRHENGGLLDMLQWGNLTYALFGWQVSLPKDFDVKLQVLRFQRTDNGSLYLGRYGTVFMKEKPAENNSKVLGNELDLQITKKFGSDFQTKFLGGVFIPKKGILSLLKNQNIFSQLQLTALYKF